MATYVPILGNFAAPFSIVNGAAAAVARDGTATLQGDPRPGTMRTSFILYIPDGDAANEDSYTIQVPSPYEFTADDLTTSENSFWPAELSCVPLDAASRLMFPIATIGIPANWSVANQTIALGILLTVPLNGLCGVLFSVDFSHTATS
jgi:hypothetical protein